MKFAFTQKIENILKKEFANISIRIFEKSLLIEYINKKTKSANKGSKSRSSFANLYAIYALIEDYVNKGFINSKSYNSYEGAKFTDLLKRIRQMYAGSKLQNHALNHRMNSEFKKYFPKSEIIPIIRDTENSRYWINEDLIIIGVEGKSYNIANVVLKIIDEYIRVKKEALDNFILECELLSKASVANMDNQAIKDFILRLLDKNKDARLFEIVSYSILKYHYSNITIFWGYDKNSLIDENLKLYKTGRTNANDGGIDFVMKPLGVFFQVTETLDFKKYFLDIDKIDRYPITFVVKTESHSSEINNLITNSAKEIYKIDVVIKKYLNCIEEIITINELKKYLDEINSLNKLPDVLNEIILQSKLEFDFFNNTNE